jgi:hypothetical protein
MEEAPLNISDAIMAVRNKEMGLTQDLEMFEILRSTLEEKVNNGEAHWSIPDQFGNQKEGGGARWKGWAKGKGDILWYWFLRAARARHFCLDPCPLSRLQ